MSDHISISAMIHCCSKHEISTLSSASSVKIVEHFVPKTNLLDYNIDIHSQLSLASDDIFRRCHLIQSSSLCRDLVLIRYYPISKNVIIDSDAFFNNRSPAKYIFHVLESFAYLLDTFILFQEKGQICFLDFSIDHLGFYHIDNPHCFLHSFDHCLNTDYIHSINYLKTLFANLSLVQQPFEIHVLHYLLFHGKEEEEKHQITLTTDDIKNIIRSFTKINKINVISSSFLQQCKSFFSSYFRWPKEKIILHIVEQWHSTWNGYRLSILYLQFVTNIINSFHINMPFMLEWQRLLQTNVSFDLYERRTLRTTKYVFHQLFVEHNQWGNKTNKK
jgi:hypothetical protein